ncbi:sam 1 link chp: radical sam-linked protein [Lucifera butyrica]|uniref:Sam 1 link chp: radical sam-linked protein n=1 Tax=Lucifera butyrica TaxID=1351585 RepID=A0A498RCS4_9FIRM|nr:TIGR03936 family radical SAM-associated protein [Lucifera butyrica]VBB07873.1 sam 1 link chp: radical sam-linked protein [Lucifera butyrica]
MTRIRLELTKGLAVRYISHLDYSRALERAFRRAKLPVAYSEGFNPHMKVAFASALAVGVTSDAEYMDVELVDKMDLAAIQECLAGQMPPGIAIKQVKYVDIHAPALMAIVNLAHYRIIVPVAENTSPADIERSMEQFKTAAEIPYTRISPKGKREINIKQFLGGDMTAVVADQTIELSFDIRITPTGSIKPGEVLDALVTFFKLPVRQDGAAIHRTGLFIADGTLRQSPMDL